MCCLEKFPSIYYAIMDNPALGGERQGKNDVMGRGRGILWNREEGVHDKNKKIP